MSSIETINDEVEDLGSENGQPGFHESVDLNVLKSYDDPDAGDEGDLAVELIDLYLTEGLNLTRMIKNAFSSRDWHAAKRGAHTLRGSSGNLGILQMAIICEEIEHLDLENLGLASQELVATLENEFARVEKILLEERKRRTNENTDR